MSEQNECKIVFDLMPSYVDGICSKESKEYVEEHIKKCEECKKVYDLMMADLKEEGFDSDVKLDDITINQEKIISGVKARMKKDAQKKAIAYGIFGLFVVIILIISLIPIKSIPQNKITFAKNSFKISDYIGEKCKFSAEDDKAIYYMEDDADIDKATFYKFESPMEFESDIYMEENWLKSHETISVVDMSSKYVVKKYDYSVKSENGCNTLYLDKAKTSIFDGEQEGDYTIRFIVPCDVTEFDFAY